ncbi:MAG: endonuclease/exonuclease/phosphatase family protein [Vicinamibacterales bacterium]
MKLTQIATLVLVAALAAACARTPAPHLTPAPPALAVISWNLDEGDGNIEALLADLAAGRIVRPVPGAWVLLLQELTRLPGGLAYSFVAPVRQLEDGESLGTAIVSSLPLENAHAIRLPQARQPRAAAAATIRVAGTPFLIVSVHLENRGSWWQAGLLSEAGRERQARALLDELPADGPGVLGGDLNTWLGPTEPAWRLLVGRFPDLPPTRRDVTFRDRLVLDHVLFDLPAGWAAERRVLDDRYGSDHHPVLGVMTAP